MTNLDLAKQFLREMIISGESGDAVEMFAEWLDKRAQEPTCCTDCLESPGADGKIRHKVGCSAEWSEPPAPQVPAKVSPHCNGTNCKGHPDNCFGHPNDCGCTLNRGAES